MSRFQTSDVFFETFQDQLDRWIPVKYLARCVKPNESNDQKIYKLFRCSVLAKVLFRTTRTIRMWEADDRIPRPRFAFDDPAMHRIGNGDGCRQKAAR